MATDVPVLDATARTTAVTGGPDAEPESADAGARPPRGGWATAVRMHRLAGWVAILSVAAYPVMEAFRTIAQRTAGPLVGPEGPLDISARNAWRLSQLVGLPARFGGHEPGPALAYLMSPFVHAYSSTPAAAESLGAIMINGAALVAAVAVLWRRFGPACALWAATCIDLWSLCIGLGLLREPRPGFVVVAPIVLFVVLWTVAITGQPGAWLWAVVVASYAIQTHLPVAFFAVVMLAIGGIAGLMSASGNDRLELPWHWWRAPARSSGWVALALIWLAPIIEVFHDRHTTVHSLYDFVTSSYPVAGWHTAIRGTIAAATILPFGTTTSSGGWGRDTAQVIVICIVFGVGTLVALWVAGRRRSPTARWFVIAAILGLLLGAFSFSRSPELVSVAATAWLSYAPLAVLLGLGVALTGPLGPLPVGPTGLLALLKKPYKKLKKRLAKRHGGHVATHHGDGSHSKVGKAADKKAAGAEKKAKGKAKKAGESAQNADKKKLGPALDWAAVPDWAIAFLAVVALVAGGATIGSGDSLSALAAPSASHPAQVAPVASSTPSRGGPSEP